ncbi:MAG: hypothetical protein CL926_01220 [Deltaproteobacteria bacterium]|nr:hypothetical protein [Deltaproteobacteria bacterium]
MKNENMKNEKIEHEEMTEEERELMEFKVKEIMNVIADMETTLEKMVNLGTNNSEAYLSLQQTVNNLREVMQGLQDQLESDDCMTENNGEQSTESNNSTSFEIGTPFGPLQIDLSDYDAAQTALAATRKKVETRNFTEQVYFDFFGQESVREGKYWPGNLGRLMKIHSEPYISKEWECVDEFSIHERRKIACTYQTYDFPHARKERFLSLGIRFFQLRKNSEIRCAVEFSIDSDGDHRLTLLRPKSEILQTRYGENAPSNLLDDLYEDFFFNGPLKGEFFDLRYNFIDRDPSIEELIAWDDEVKELLWNDVVMFQKAMPNLFERGMPNSRGIILAGPPGTGKTMIAKWLAANSDITCILISAEMIGGRHDIKKCYEIARKLSPSLLIIEDIDTAGALDRRASDHPLLGEFLQAMDGVVPNHGVITLATTNHSDKIDPAIADRPGRFDRIIEVGLPLKAQRYHILRQLIAKMDVDDSVNTSAIKSLAKGSEGLTGAWLREIVQSAFIIALSNDRKIISNSDLITSLKDVMKRRGMAYRVTGYGAQGADSQSTYLIYE